MLAGEFFINPEHFVRLGHGFLHRFVGCVSLLPKKFGRAEEKAGTHFPSDHIGPLVDEQREVAVALHPAGIGRADDGLRGRADDERLVQLAGRDELAILFFQPVVGDHGALLGETLHMLGFLLEKTERDEERKVCIHMPGGLEHDIELTLHVFPDPPAPRLDDHAAADVRIFGQVSGFDHLLIPLGKVVGAGRGDGGLHGKLRVEG